MRRSILWVLAGFAGACSSPTAEEDGTLVLGTIAFYSEEVVIQVPDTATAGVPFEVLVRTYGGGCERLGPTDVKVVGDSVTVTPFDYSVRDERVACPDVLRTFDHEVSLELAVPGSVTITILGLELPGPVDFAETRSVVVRAR